MAEGELVLSLAGAAQESWLQWHGHREAGDQTNQAQIQDLELDRPSIYAIYELLKHLEGAVLPNRSHRTSWTRGNRGISERSFSESAEVMVLQKP